MKIILSLIILLCMATSSAHAEFIVTSAIVEFSKDKPPQQDIEIVSRSNENDYIVTEIREVLNPGAISEKQVPVTDAAQSRLLVTPDRTILSGGGRKTIRFVLLKPLDDAEHIYRVALKPVVKGVNNNSTLGLKILIGYEVLVILRPTELHSSYEVTRQGKTLTIHNKGNTNIVLQNGQQCSSAENCKMPPTTRSYASQTTTTELPFDGPVTYAVWDGVKTVEKTIN